MLQRSAKWRCWVQVRVARRWANPGTPARPVLFYISAQAGSDIRTVRVRLLLHNIPLCTVAPLICTDMRSTAVSQVAHISLSP